MGAENSGLSYVHFGKWEPLPDWANAYLALGQSLGSLGGSPKRTVFAAAVPTRTCAAVLAAIGAVRASLADPANKTDKQQYFESLKRLPLGAKLRYQQGDKSLKALFDGLSTSNGKAFLRIQVNNSRAGGKAFLVGMESAHQVETVNADEWELPKTQSGRPVRVRKTFLEHVYGAAGGELVTRTKLDCVIVGRLSVLKEEIKDTTFGVPTGDGEYATGTLQDVLRVRSFLPTGQPFRSDVISAHSESSPNPGDVESARLVIFDGAPSYLRCRHHWRSSNSLVLLDRTEPQFEAAAGAINDEYVQTRTGESAASLSAGLPEGIESVGFEVSKR